LTFVNQVRFLRRHFSNAVHNDTYAVTGSLLLSPVSANCAVIPKGCLVVCLTGEIEMKQLLIATRNFLREEEGVTMIEYGLIAALIALAVIATVTLIGTALNEQFVKIQTCLTTPANCGK
jgi:pilus assembly protein Flp/PilA